MQSEWSSEGNSLESNINMKYCSIDTRSSYYSPIKQALINHVSCPIYTVFTTSELLSEITKWHVLNYLRDTKILNIL